MSGDARREEDELDRDVRVRMGKSRLQRHIKHQRQMEPRLMEMAKRALALGDRERFVQVGRQLLWTRDDIKRWEKFVLSLEVLEARREQTRASVELLNSVKAMSESMIDLADPRSTAELSRQLNEGLARAEGMEERISMMMEMMDSTLADGMPAEDDQINELESNLNSEIGQEKSDQERDIEEMLKKVREAGRDEERK
jgi:hypothetical protein